MAKSMTSSKVCHTLFTIDYYKFAHYYKFPTGLFRPMGTGGDAAAAAAAADIAAE